MENNKLEQLTKKLYDEGLSKGRSQGEKIIAEAEARAKEIVSEAEARAKEIVRKAETGAEDLRKNTMTEIALAGRQAASKIKENIAGMIVARSVEGGVKQATLDPAFVKDVLLNVSKNWHGASHDKVTLKALLPESKQKELDAAFSSSVGELLDAGIEVGYSKDVRTGFKVGEKSGGYYIGFSDENFEALLGEYLREKVSKILFEAK